MLAHVRGPLLCLDELRKCVTLLMLLVLVMMQRRFLLSSLGISNLL
jgi:hypothetical protein